MLLKKGIGVLLFAIVFWACEDILEEPDISQIEVQLLAPTDGAVIVDNEVSFNWNFVEDTRSYKIQLAKPSFANAVQIVFDSLIEQDSLGDLDTRIQNIRILNGQYQWRVKALNGGFETAYTTATFIIDGDENLDIIPPNTPQLVAPENNASVNETQIDFSWTRVEVSGTAERDSIYIYTDEALQNLSIKGLGANKTFNTTLTSGTYYWLAQAFDAGGNVSDDSETRTLTVN